jgi:excinuclease UvrABC nuclease subunit
MASFEILKILTDKFFQRHWDIKSGHAIPIWKNEWSWKNSVPYHNKPGVYALFDANKNIVYIGLGASRGSHGIARRLVAHVIKRSPIKGHNYYAPKKIWAEVSDIGAIGFPSEYSYLALALEDYLIGELNPPRNRAKKKSKTCEVRT